MGFEQPNHTVYLSYSTHPCLLQFYSSPLLRPISPSGVCFASLLFLVWAPESLLASLSSFVIPYHHHHLLANMASNADMAMNPWEVQALDVIQT